MIVSKANIKQRIGLRIRGIRTELGLSQLQVSQICDMERTWFAHIENGRKNISAETLDKLLEGIGMSYVDFFNHQLFAKPVENKLPERPKAEYSNITRDKIIEGISEKSDKDITISTSVLMDEILKLPKRPIPSVREKSDEVRFTFLPHRIADYQLGSFAEVMSVPYVELSFKYNYRVETWELIIPTIKL